MYDYNAGGDVNQSISVLFYICSQQGDIGQTIDDDDGGDDFVHDNNNYNKNNNDDGYGGDDDDADV